MTLQTCPKCGRDDVAIIEDKRGRWHCEHCGAYLPERNKKGE